MTLDLNVEQLWKSTESFSITEKKETFKATNSSMAEFFMKKILRKQKMEIGVFVYGQNTGAALSYREPKKEITLRLKSKAAYQIVLTLINNQNELYSFIYDLSGKEVKLIPKGLQLLMNKVKNTGEPRDISLAAL